MQISVRPATISGVASYQWTGPSGVYPAQSNPFFMINRITAAQAGAYTVTITNTNGCTVTLTTNITVRSTPVVTASNTGPYCVGAPITVTAASSTPNLTYNWSAVNGNATYTGNPVLPGAAVYPVTNGFYFVTGTDAFGCSGRASTEVRINAPYSVTAYNLVSGANLRIYSQTINGAVSYLWSGPGGYTFNGRSNYIAHPTSANNGTYCVTVTLTSGCVLTACTTVSGITPRLTDESLEPTSATLSVYPNPTTGMLNFDLTQEQSTIAQWQVISLDGRVVMSGETVEGNDITQSLDLTSMTNGVYLLRVKTGEQVLTQRVVVNH
jgi:hypothetical protein